MKVLVTGCAGFIGQATTKELLKQGHFVVGTDNMNNMYDVALKHYRLSQILSNPQFDFYNYDIEDNRSLSYLFKKYYFDCVIHLAARAGVRASVSDPLSYYQTNLIGTLNILEMLRQYPSKLVYSSTSSVYEGCEMPYNEKITGGVLLSPYASSKFAAESICGVYHSLYGIDISVLRFFTVYGPMGRPDMAPWMFTEKILKGDPIIIYGDGNQKRDFTYIDDIVNGIVKAIPLVGHETINLGSDNPYPVNDLINIIEIYSGEKAIRKYEPRNISDMESTHADITKAKNILNWQPKISLNQGMMQMIAWYIKEWNKEAA